MKPRTRQLLDGVDSVHDWIEGPLYAGSGTQRSRVDICQVCGLRRAYFADPQNGIDASYKFFSHDDKPLTLLDAFAAGCGGES